MLLGGGSIFEGAAAAVTRSALGDLAQILERSAEVFNDMARLLRTRNNAQLLNFVRKVHKQIEALPEGESILLPAILEGVEILLLLERVSDRSYMLVVINTNPDGGLKYHAVSPAARPGRLMYRTCMVLSSIPKKSIMDDVFWMAVYNLAVNGQNGDTDKFYDILVPFLTGKSLESTLLEAELSEADTSRSTETVCLYGPWRTPQRSQTDFVRCLYQAFNFILTRRRGMSAFRSKQVGLALRMEFVKMVFHDVKQMYPDESQQQVCALTLRQLCYRASKMADSWAALCKEAQDEAESFVCPVCLQAAPASESFVGFSCGHRVHGKCMDKLAQSGSTSCPICADGITAAQSINAILESVLVLERDCRAELEAAREERIQSPPKINLDLSSAWSGHAVAWDDENSNADPGRGGQLQKYLPIDLLQLPTRVDMRDQAAQALRTCDHLCTLISNQTYYVKNHQHLIVSLVEYVLVHLVPIPKPRAVKLSDSDAARAARSQQRMSVVAQVQKELECKREELLNAKALQRGKDSLASQSAMEDNADDPVITENVDLNPGIKAILRATTEPCIWDADCEYQFQLDLLIVLQRIMEHFSAALLSLQANRCNDAVSVVVPGCICVLADAIIRRRATDKPSEACTHLMGQDKYGRQLGIFGFGIGVGSFATQTETVEIYTPELAVARSAILDYFGSPSQRVLDKIFTWEEKFELFPGRPLIKYLRMIAREIAITPSEPQKLMCDNLPESSLLLKNFPELRCYRDICFYWKYFLNPDASAFPNFIQAPTVGQMDTILIWQWASDSGYQVISRLYCGMKCAPEPKAKNVSGSADTKSIQDTPTHRYPSTATPSFYASKPTIQTEDDVVYRPNLPTFADPVETVSSAGGQLGLRDAELLLSFLTVPYIRIPLVLNFFAAEDRVHKLISSKLRGILDSVLFEPGKHLAISQHGVEPTIVPTQHSELLASPYGALLNELYCSPEVTCKSVVALLDAALALDTGSVCDRAGKDFNASVTIILYISRLGARVLNYIDFVVLHSEGKHETIDFPMRQEPDPAVLSILKTAHADIGMCIAIV
jgi:hypothetical protein